MAGKKGRENVTGIVKIALVAAVVMIGLTPLANAAITSFTITPDTLVAGECEETLFVVWVNSSTDMHWQNTSIPGGCEFIAPTESGVTIVSTQFWDASGPVGTVAITTNNTDPQAPTVDVAYSVGSDSAVVPGLPISFEPGTCFSLVIGRSRLDMCLPSETTAGYMNVSTYLALRSFRDEWLVRYCCPPGTTSESVFTAIAEGDLEGMDAPIICVPRTAVPVYNALGMTGLIGIMSVFLGFATLRRRR
ncbi:MAG TPA: hypothetical protein ENN68_04125 [Methanomicrobia archaeon]|nr:hypothetical protein [Methanomicrobia archaeon]